MFDHRRRPLLSPGMLPVNRRQLLKASGAAGLAAGLPAARRASAQGQVTIQYKTHDHPPAVELNTALVAEFMEANPDINVEYEGIPYPSFEQGLFTSFAGGDGWDVFWAGDWLTPQFFENDILAPVDFSAYGVSDLEGYLGLYDPGSVDAFVNDGNVYSGGVSEYNTFSLIYNPDHFAAAGIDPLSETEPVTWEQLAEWGPQLAQFGADGARSRNALEWAFDANVWTPLIAEPMARQLGGDLADEAGEPTLTNEQVVKTFDYFGQLAENTSVDPAFFVNIVDDYAQDRVSMIIGGVWALPAIRAANPDAKIAVAPLPIWEGTERNTILYSWSWFVGNQSSAEEQAAAWKLTNFLSAQAKRWWDDCGFIQARNVGVEGVEDIAAYRAETEPALAVFNSDFAEGSYMFRSTRFYEIADALLRSQSLVFEGEDAQSTLEDEQSELEI